LEYSQLLQISKPAPYSPAVIMQSIKDIFKGRSISHLDSTNRAHSGFIVRISQRAIFTFGTLDNSVRHTTFFYNLQHFSHSSYRVVYRGTVVFLIGPRAAFLVKLTLVILHSVFLSVYWLINCCFMSGVRWRFDIGR